MIVLYNILLAVLFVPLLAVVLVRYRRRGGGRGRWQERLGLWDFAFARRNDPSRPLLWVHCASLGEVRAIEPLLRDLAGSYRLLLTTLTQSGHDYASRNGVADQVFLAPLDFSFIVNRVMDRVRPGALVLVETEFWPGLINAAGRAGVRVMTINGRLSLRSYPYYRMTRRFWESFLRTFTLICARAPEDAERFAVLGCPRERVVFTGNIKYDRPAAAHDFSRERVFLDRGDTVFVAGSTRSGEEELLASAWLDVRRRHPGLKLVIAPRHLERVDEIAGMLERLGIRCARYSSLSGRGYDCLLVDAFGELQKFYFLCDVAFVGGSLVNKGGQNPIEPAACRKPVIFGPYMHNFQHESRVLKESGGGIEVSDAGDLSACIERLINDPAARERAGEAAQRAVENQRGALAATRRMIDAVVTGPEPS